MNWNNSIKKGNTLTLTYFCNYIYEFPLDWETLGSRNLRTVPKQFSHDLSLTYAMKNGTYNIALEGKNITDEKLYDNFKLQKPGKAFYVKIRYFFSK